jgi:hypothetical protein
MAPITDVVTFVDLDATCRFLQTVTDRIQGRDATGFYHVHRGALDDEPLQRIRTIFDDQQFWERDHHA